MKNKIVANNTKSVLTFFPECLSPVKVGHLPNTFTSKNGISFLSAGLLEQFSIHELSTYLRLIEFDTFNYPYSNTPSQLPIKIIEPQLLKVSGLELTVRNIKAIKSAWLHYKNVQNNGVVFAIEKGTLIGFIEICESAKSVSKIAIIHEFQGKKIGDELLESALKMFIHLGITNPTISASPGSEKFYDRFFRETKTITEVDQNYNVTIKCSQTTSLNGKKPKTTYYLNIS
ncbi:MAG: GNAT family N-acetyltransferase [Candidatus Riflemargulisbacteria bacterium]